MNGFFKFSSLACFLTLAALGCPAVPNAQHTKTASATLVRSRQASSTQEPTSEINAPFIVNTDLITFNVTVTDPQGRFVPGLKRDAFRLYDEKQPQRIDFFSDDDRPLSIGIVFDVSGSMRPERIKNAEEALRHFIETSDEDDDYFLLAFNSRSQILIENTHDTTSLLNTLVEVHPHGNTALLDAVYLAVNKLQMARQDRRALLLITDGGENDSRYKFSQVVRVLEESGVMLYSVGMLNSIDLASKPGFTAHVLLHELAKTTGGRDFFPQNAAEMDEDFEKIALELRHQYSIGYRPKDFKRDGKWHRVKVEMSPESDLPHLIVRSRQGYFALAHPK